MTHVILKLQKSYLHHFYDVFVPQEVPMYQIMSHELIFRISTQSSYELDATRPLS